MSYELDLLRRIVSIYSPSGAEGELAEELLRVLKVEWGFESWIDEVGNVIAVKGRGDPVIMLHAHMDTITPQIPTEVKGSVVYGRGAVDDKASLTSMMLAFRGARPKGTLILALVVGEEDDSRGTRHLLRTSEVPRPHYIIVGEPTNHHIVYAYRGGAKVLARSTGSRSHSSNPVADNPIVKVFDIYKRLTEALDVGSDYGKFGVVPTVIRGGEHPSTTPTECELIIDVRIPHGYDCAFLADVARSVGTTAISCTDPVQVDPLNPIGRALVRSLLKHGLRPILSKKRGTSDMNELVALTRNIVAYGPGDPSLAHTDEERVDVNDVILAASVLRKAVEEVPA